MNEIIPLLKNRKNFKFSFLNYVKNLVLSISVFFSFGCFSQSFFAAKLDEGLLFLSVSDSVYELTLFNPDTTEVLGYSKGTYRLENDSISLNSYPELDPYVIESFMCPTKGEFVLDTCYFVFLNHPVIVSQYMEIRFTRGRKEYSFSSNDGLMVKVPRDSLNGINKLCFFSGEFSTYCMEWSEEMHQIENFFFVGISSQQFDWSKYYLPANLTAFGRKFNFEEASEIMNYTFHNCYFSKSEVVIPNFSLPRLFENDFNVVLKRIK